MTNPSPTPILYDTHMHTPLCKHAKGTPGDYAAHAEKRGLKGIIVTCHNPGPDMAFSNRVRMNPDQFDEYVQMVQQAQDEWAGRVDVRLGLECDFLPDMIPFLTDLLARADFHHILGSVHPQLPYYRERYDNGRAVDFFATYYDILAQAAESGLFNTLSHPDLVKNTYSDQWQLDEDTLETICASLDRIAAAGTAMELNTSGLHKRIREMNPAPAILREMRVRNIPVVIGSDAHEPKRVAAEFEDALDLLTSSGYTQTSIFLNRQRHDIDIATALDSLQTVKRFSFL